MKTFRRTALVSLVCAAAVTFSGVSAAHAAVQPSAVASVSTEEVTQQQIDELAGYLEALHEGELRTSDGKFDRKAAVAKFGSAFADAVEAEIAAQRPASSASEAAPALRAAAAKKDSYGKCLLKAVGLGGLGGATTAIMNKLSEKRWSDAARLITKEAAKRGIKLAGKGGVVGIAASLAASSIWCATPWA
ncbi:hypothetical protein [Streptomyces sp. NBC_00286]|uniref:hypothetical protein n=1 Tax=Streptomyces sp. NBC_00286 TaxID=2975701 RepID=UPI002E2CF524|nr:hypothetical protein [Streptomyces sp. NBC_00286]